MEPSGPATDEVPSSPLPPSPTSAVTTPVSSQPTYTTAGTIYNPSSSQRLQPPARRGRLLKLNPESACFVFDPSRFGSPRSILSQPDTSVKTPAIATVKQYSPLQQNYDRAVSPAASPDRESAMSPQPFALHNPPLRARVDSLPLSRLDKGHGSKATADSSDDDGDSISVGALKNMTVKSLQNLASYPNPNQKSAQKALLRGTRPKAGNTLGSGLSGLAQPFAYRNISPGGVRLSSSDEPAIGLRPTLSDPSALHHNYMDRRRRSRMMTSDAGPSGTYASLFESRRSTPSTNDDMPDSHPTASMRLATGPGAPKPLTAGPPGQRQYRPSTFESTFKALKSRATAHQASVTNAEDDSDAAPFTPRAFSTVASAGHYQYSSAEDEEYQSAAESIFNEVKARTRPMTPAIPPDSLLYLTIHSEPEWPREREPTHDVREYTHPAYDTRGASIGNCNTPERIFLNLVGLGHGAPSIMPTNWQSEMNNGNSSHWDEPTGPMFPQQTGPKILTQQEIAERSRKLHDSWYSGLGQGLGVSTVFPKPVDRSVKRPDRRSIYGAVGDGRPTGVKQSSSAARGDSGELKSSNSMQSINSDVAGLALLGEVLSRAT
ncbi:hypothetical protein BBK36DRAFT_1174549 [Trichoderma citrinoviride]|uniref:Uncharacterized protein n=1 Tax=Trichoderma citrinoviride TaxID=58853 RepID=A0A2T4BMH5_9HYPO|nr:hypothetical protein BBK36DRAFT_1174549 [Trichoderma citrinoviride]PTB70524.1 hypothetical protein BBK36DRAFT_1174549 [Trichoderma citrinoviride]